MSRLKLKLSSEFFILSYFHKYHDVTKHTHKLSYISNVLITNHSIFRSLTM